MSKKNRTGIEENDEDNNAETEFTWEGFERVLHENMELTEKYGKLEDDKDELERLKKKVAAALDEKAKEPCDRGVFRRYASWAETLHMKILDFREERRVFPNIMLASRYTYDKIDASFENAENVIREARNEDSFEDYGDFDFIDGKCALHFCIDDTLKKGEFRLVYDGDPDFGGEESPYALLNAA